MFEEVPDEVTLAFNISGCPVHCQGCHSKYLWEYDGEYLRVDFDKLLDRYRGLITCVCFMGGDQNMEELEYFCKIAKIDGYKTCLYTGHKLSPGLKAFALKWLDYLKIGKYDEKFGALNSPNTNQKMYRIDNKNEMVNITNRFWRLNDGNTGLER